VNVPPGSWYVPRFGQPDEYQPPPWRVPRFDRQAPTASTQRARYASQSAPDTWKTPRFDQPPERQPPLRVPRFDQLLEDVSAPLAWREKWHRFREFAVSHFEIGGPLRDFLGLPERPPPIMAFDAKPKPSLLDRHAKLTRDFMRPDYDRPLELLRRYERALIELDDAAAPSRRGRPRGVTRPRAEVEEQLRSMLDGGELHRGMTVSQAIEVAGLRGRIDRGEISEATVTVVWRSLR
jgi:hypothetical protein